MADYTETASDGVVFSDTLTITEIVLVAEPEEDALANEGIITAKQPSESAVANEEVARILSGKLKPEESVVGQEAVTNYNNPAVEESGIGREDVDYFGDFVRFPTDICTAYEEVLLERKKEAVANDYAIGQEEVIGTLFQGQVLEWKGCSRYNDSNTGATWTTCSPFD
jgi:hypothetical protein